MRISKRLIQLYQNYLFALGLALCMLTMSPLVKIARAEYLTRHTHISALFLFSVVSSSVTLYFSNQYRHLSVSKTPSCHHLNAVVIHSSVTRRRERVTLPSNLVASFPLLLLSPSHMICSMCHRKLYAMQNTSSAGHLSDSMRQNSTENATDRSLLIHGAVDHKDIDQLTTDAESGIELPDEGHNLNKTTRCSDEDGSVSSVAETSKDGSESRHSGISDLNEYVEKSLTEN